MNRIARLYGASLYDLAAEEGLEEKIGEQMGEVRTLFLENPLYVKLLSQPSIPLPRRKEMIEDALGRQAERYLVNFLKLLCDKGILREYPECCEEFTRRFDWDHDIARASVTSAVELTPAQTQALQAKLEKISGKRIMLTQILDPSVVGGLRVELEGKSLDGTVKSRLLGLAKKLNEVTD